VVIDPGGDDDQILDRLKYHQLNLKYIIDTHGHFDHVDANQPLKDATGAQVAIHQADARMLDQPSNEALMFTGNRLRLSKADILLKEDDVISFGSYRLKVLHTPGHTPGGISLVMEGHPYVYVGDLLFAGSIGRTDFPGGSYDDLIAAVRAKIFPLGDNYTVYPGHGPVTTVGQERKYNPFF
jgi:hydroxyacylglutathione hydrolase